MPSVLVQRADLSQSKGCELEPCMLPYLICATLRISFLRSMHTVMVNIDAYKTGYRVTPRNRPNRYCIMYSGLFVRELKAVEPKLRFFLW